MDANNNSCALEPTLDAPAIETPEAPTPGDEDAATHGAQDVRPAASDIIDINEEILRLGRLGVYAVPVRILTDAAGKKRTAFPSGGWKSFQSIEYWKAHIHDCLQWSEANGLAILTEPSDLYCIDIDVASTRVKRSGAEKQAGTELWGELVAAHGEPATLKAVTGSGGFHYYFWSSGASSPVAAELSDGLSTPPSFASADAGAPSSSLASGDAAPEWVGEASVPAHLELLVRELKTMLREKANDSTSVSAFLNFVAEVARTGGGQPFEGLAKIFSLIYQTEGRILNTGEKKIFFFWDGRGWIEDTCNKVLGVFAAQMGALLNWYEQERLGLFLRIFLDKLSELDPALKTIDKAAVQRYLSDPKWKQIRDESERQVKVDLPAIIFNVQDPTVVRKCLQYVVTDLYVADLSSHMNKDPLLVNFQNGVGYIPTGKLMKPHPSHLCSLMAGGEYHPRPIGTRSRFKEFLLDVANGDEEVVRWKILWLGYCLSGYTDEELVVFWWGEGGNGKGALKQAILAAWGDYGIICSKHIFMKTKDDTASAATSHLAQLQGVRMGIADELDDGKIINAATIKEQTGGGSISARELFEKMKNFIPTHKLALLTNNKPRIPVEEVNQGLLRRIVLEVYPNQYVEDSEFNPEIATHRRADVGLKMYLESKEGIEDVTRVVFEGAHEWYKLRTANDKIQKVLWPRPRVFTEACNEYLKENDTLSTFLEQECLLGPNEVVVMSELSTAYKARECEDQRMTSQAFTKALKAHNITTDRKHPQVPKLNGYGSGRPYIGVRLLRQEELEKRHATAKVEVREWQKGGG
ncbi:hypothetical protein KFL_002280230 [Klebsormidium nitens]|uniref:SF3 helicase domain-containing protein n=1 Tax=Klebsormidium nitens TaxID=105231 RepID=A0A1Y1I7A9_KLENI|nr:hypothetical protein KFL_002280230 [Klebsormidium nitens]|eukprot:GAQ85309.1 hypothetical protein KFL_002280230 [Klebsormidium nitens]